VASLATELIKGKTPEEALALKGEDLAGDLGPLPPMKIHCGQLVEGALKSALDPAQSVPAQPARPDKTAGSLLDNFASQEPAKKKLVFLD
jgi:nitrogen fixation protein NifU and related proteins